MFWHFFPSSFSFTHCVLYFFYPWLWSTTLLTKMYYHTKSYRRYVYINNIKKNIHKKWNGMMFIFFFLFLFIFIDIMSTLFASWLSTALYTKRFFFAFVWRQVRKNKVIILHLNIDIYVDISSFSAKNSKWESISW